MNAAEIKILLLIIDAFRSGAERVDVFDLVYETGLRYPEIKPHLDGLVSAGEIAAADLRYYALCGNADEKLKELTEKFPDGVRRARSELENGVGNARAAENEDDAADAGRRNAFERRREEFLRRMQERREAVAAMQAEEDEDDDDNDEDDDDIDYGEIRRIIAENEGKEEDEEGGEADEEGGEADDSFYMANREKYSDELKSVIGEAFKFAQSRQTDFVGSGHFVYAMLFVDCEARRMLDDSSVSRVFYGYSLRSAFSDLPKSTCAELSGEAQAMLNRAVEIAAETGGEGALANTAHLLKAVMEKPDCIAVQCLAAARTDMEKLAGELEKYLHGG